jgi:DeoR family transcriptional regulator, fructose operon transcriptional repressor
MGKGSARESEILKVLQEKQKLSLSEIISYFNISDSTARRLCVNLAQKGRVIRGFGGIYSIPEATDTRVNYEYDVIEAENAQEKSQIGAFACMYVENNDTIFLSGGTTLAQFSKHLAERLKQGLISKATITTNSIINAEILSPYTKVLLIGGEYNPHRRDVAGFFSEKMITGIHFNKCFLGIDAIDVEAGLMAFDVETASLDYLVSMHSDKKIILADSQKFMRKSYITYSFITPSHLVITDNKIDATVLSQASDKGIKITIVQGNTKPA